ncbi:type VII secretion target [Nocardia higoensis]|uniref:type VII secretion target n=1 Tax=Nocardia higoensis TaxID=228599 RepID=UPI0012F659B6|nr:type VII secretion target [Nocardia higoensis]
MNVDPVEMRELGTRLRWQAGIVEGHQPLAKETRDAARDGTNPSQTFTRVQEVLGALDRVVRYHAEQMRAVADEIDTAAATYETQDGANAKSIERMGPR